MSIQTWQPERYLRNAGFVAQLGLPVVELLQPRPGERSGLGDMLGAGVLLLAVAGMVWLGGTVFHFLIGL